ncbi:MAG: XdhC family protein [Phenylobacterium sp.]|jgi:xanthine dehydrogenase accessory factor|uniref:XdhC family protein n=1 Tax=Phenylobacterium sp. TaxID=1871053 RepID=UPI002A2D6E69|nr:XdhC family protein [Phenylobacterium sp.]MDD3838673.1 XdhC family protein [Phenylobacterium sp.]MDX9996611.1 XdhC family protein [Phenylobacterium sp.]
MLDPLPEWPTFGLAEDVRPALARAKAAGKPMVLATLVALEGGGPRPVGTQMVFAEGLVAGYFSGGCVEGDIAGHAAACLEDGEPRRLVYGEGSPWPDIRLLCGARIEVFLEKVAADDPALAELLRLTEQRRPALWVSDGRRRVCAPPGEADMWKEAITRPYEPVPRLAVVGSDPTALAIAGLGAQAGFETTLIRPKGPEAPPPIPGIGYLRSEPAEALAQIGPDEWTAVAVATHDLETDQAALRAALPSPAGYVGLLGARARLAERLARLRAAGAPEDAIAKLHAPIGLDLGGAKAPWEVAVSVIGEIVALRQVRASGSTSTSPPASTAGAPGGRRSSASA